MTREETIKILAILQVTYPISFAKIGRDEKKQMVALWHDMFSDYSYQEVDSAVRAYIATNEGNYAPSVGKIRSMIVKLTKPETGLMTAQEASTLLLRAVSDSTYHSVKQFNRLPEIIQRVVRDPMTLKEWAQIDPETFQTVIISNFQRSYQVALRQEMENAKLPDDLKYLNKRNERQDTLKNPVEMKLVGIGKTLDELSG